MKKTFLKFALFAIFVLPFAVHAAQINPPVIFDGVGNEKLRECPTFDCKVVQYGAIIPRIQIIESSGEWYKVHLIERGYFDNSTQQAKELPESEWKTTTGWMYYTLIPENILSKIGGSSEIKKDELIGTATLKKQSAILNCPSTNNCTLLTYVDAGTVLQIVGVDNTREWYKVKIDDPILAGWDKWIQANNFTDESKNLIGKTPESIGTSTSSSQPTNLGIGGWLKNNFDQIRSYSKKALLILVIFALIVLFYLAKKYRLFSKISFSWLKSHRTISVGVSILCIVVVFFFVSNYYQKREVELKDFLVSQQKTLQDTNKNFDTLNQKYNQESSQRIAQESAAKAIIQRLENKVDQGASPAKSDNLAAIVSQWSQIIARVECDFVQNQEPWTSSGSGTALGWNNQIVVLSNRHVLAPENITPSICRTKLPSSVSTYSGDDIRVSSMGADWAVLYLSNPDSQIKSITATQPAICKNKPSIGDSVVILGYPTVGSKTGITATEGIIAGYDGGFFITSAKVEQGNSGGAAILLKDNCLLGIPTFAQTGKIESLARIMDISIVLK